MIDNSAVLEKLPHPDSRAFDTTHVAYVEP